MGAGRPISFYEDNVVLMSPLFVAVEFVSGLLKVAMSSIAHSQCLASLREAVGGLTLLRGNTLYFRSWLSLQLD